MESSFQNHHRHHKTNNATQFHTIRWKFRKTWEKKWSECSTIFGRSTRASTPCLRMSDQSWIPAAVRLANPPLRPSKRLKGAALASRRPPPRRPPPRRLLPRSECMNVSINTTHFSFYKRQKKSTRNPLSSPSTLLFL